MNIPIYSTGENCVFILQIVNKTETADEYDDMFTSGYNSTCLFESKAESTAECGAYFTVVHSHGVA